MKTLYKVLSSLALAALSAGLFASCQKASEKYEPAAKESGNQVYFSCDAPTEYDFKQYPSCTFDIPIYRVETSAALNVSLKVTADPLFTIPASVSFEAGSNVSSVAVSWDDAKAVAGQSYPVTIAIQNDTTVYGASLISFKCSKPAAWTKLYNGHVYEGIWAEDYGKDAGVALYVQDTDFENISYCRISNAWWELDDNYNPVKTVGDYYFYWNTVTNDIYVPEFSTGLTSKGRDIVVGTAADFFNSYYDWGMKAPSQEYFNWAIKWNNANSFANGYYDGNGGFYLGDSMWLTTDGKWTTYYDYGSTQDYFIAEGFVRLADYNDEDHIGASEPAYTGTVASQYFSKDGGTTPYCFESGLRYDEPADDKQETTVYYLTDYFTAGYCLAFTAPVLEKIKTGSSVSDVQNEQFTGLYSFGSKVYVTVAGGSVTLKENETAYPIFKIKLKVYAKDEDGNITYDFGNVVETFSANGILKDNYTIDDLYSADYEDYLGTWYITSTDFSDGEKYTYTGEMLEDVSGSSYKMVNMSGCSSYFADTLSITYNSSYGVLELAPQQINAQYDGSDIYVYLLDPDAEKFYTGNKMWGGICEDGNLAFVNLYESYGVNLCGLYYRTLAGTGLTAFYYIYGSRTYPSSAPAGTKVDKRKDCVTLDADSYPAVSAARLTKTSKKVAAPKTFNLSPIRKSARPEIKLIPEAVNF